MKIENERYVLSQELNCETLYLTNDYGFDNDIREALKVKNIISAQLIRHHFFDKHKLDLNIVPLKITYEW